MGRSDRLVRVTRGIAAIVVPLGLAVSCGEFSRNNPVDPVVPVATAMSGPDSTVAQFDTVRFTVSTDPAYDFGPIKWDAAPPLEKLDEFGTFRAPAVGSGRQGTATVRAAFGGREATKQVIVRYRPASLRFCPGAETTFSFNAVGSADSYCVYYYDRHGGLLSPVDISDLPPVTARSFDPSVATAGSYFITSVANGTTMVEISGGGFADTVTVTVKQVAVAATMGPVCASGAINLPVGQSAQLSAVAPVLDPAGAPLTDTADVAAALSSIIWHPWDQDSTLASVTPDGLVTGLKQGRVTFAYATLGNDDRVGTLGCTIYVI